MVFITFNRFYEYIVINRLSYRDIYKVLTIRCDEPSVHPCVTVSQNKYLETVKLLYVDINSTADIKL